MVKVSITLSNNSQITVEADELEVVHGVVGMVMRDLPRDLMLGYGQANGSIAHAVPDEESNSVATATTSHPPSEASRMRPPVMAGELGLNADQPTAESSFIQFCQVANPLGDMRRVVAAAEGAARFLGLADVDAEDLGRLFDLAGWRRPHSFTQTLRNSARSTFRWLERVPGRGGRYTVTDVGRSAALGQ